VTRRLACSLALLGSWLAASGASAQLVPVPCVLAEGETLAAVATRFGVSEHDLAELNRDTDMAHIAPGAEIAVGFGERLEHRVARGETLLQIARHYGVPATDLARWNAITDPRRLRADAHLLIYAWPRLLPSSSVGRPSGGSLENGVRLRDEPYWELHDRDYAFLTRDAAAMLDVAFRALRERSPDAPRVEIRDASAEHGGPLHGHHSHQSGRDVDLAYFRLTCRGTCTHHHTTPTDLDAARMWVLLEVWLRADALDYVFVDHSLQEPLYQAAREAGATPAELARWFQWPGESDRHVGTIRHAQGHDNHMHVRFACASHDLACGPRRGEIDPP
jgi:hypothetical protein